MSVLDLKSKRKQDEIDPINLRDHCVSCRLNPQELSILDQVRGKLRRGESLRVLAFTNLPAPIPELNASAWVELARASANLNQISHRINAGEDLKIDEIRHELEAFRSRLIGV